MEFRSYILPTKQISDNSKFTDKIPITYQAPAVALFHGPSYLRSSRSNPAVVLSCFTLPYSNAPLPRPFSHKHNILRWSQITGLWVSVSLYVDFKWNVSREKVLKKIVDSSFPILLDWQSRFQCFLIYTCALSGCCTQNLLRTFKESFFYLLCEPLNGRQYCFRGHILKNLDYTLYDTVTLKEKRELLSRRLCWWSNVFQSI